MIKTIHDWFAEYGESHQNPTNKFIHWLCVPAIYFSIICLLSIPKWSFQLNVNETYNISLSTLAIVFVLIFYIRLSKPIALGMGAFSVLCVALAYQLAKQVESLWQVALIIFVIAWIGQFIGHRIEGKKPSFLKDLQFLLIGPAWLMGFIFKRFGIAY
jgi:uncharacterized membrane protein YGL010W